MRFKVIENEMPMFEKELNDFVSRNDVEVVEIKYSTSGLAPDEEYGWHTANVHNALIRYKQLIIDENTD